MITRMLIICCLGVPLIAQQTFRSETRQVVVPVSVSAGNQPVAGLSAADFSVTDNGVKQTIDESIIASVPIDVTLLVDTSGSAQRDIKQNSERASTMARIVSTSDCVSVWEMGTYVRASSDGAWGSGTRTVNPAELSSVYDAVGAAAMRATPPGHRRLIFAMTDGVDSRSSLTADRLLQIARQSDAVVFFHIGRAENERPVWQKTWVPFNDRQFETLRAVAETTGGQYTEFGDPVSTFKKAYERFRRSYVLRFSPQGVSTGGWHELKVTVNRPGRFTVVARKGYGG